MYNKHGSGRLGQARDIHSSSLHDAEIHTDICNHLARVSSGVFAIKQQSL